MRARPGRSAAPTGRRRITGVLVVVPARDEQDLLADCLAALRRAADAAGVPVLVVLVLDRCTDRSAAIAEGVSASWGSGAAREGAAVTGHSAECVGLPARARAPSSGPAVAPIRLDVVRSDAGRAGAARAIGVRHGLRALGGPPARVWLASTDADSRVPADWLTGHLALAGRGYDLVLGTVELTGGDPALARRWSEGYTTSEGHPHVHAANLGLRAETYLAAGGFAPVAAHEDAALVARVTALGGARVVRSATAPVTTSARLDGRAPAGVSADLRALALTAPSPPTCSPGRSSSAVPAAVHADGSGTGASASSISSRLIPSR